MMIETITPDESGSQFPVAGVSLSETPAPVSGGTGLDITDYKTKLDGIGEVISTQGFGAGLQAYKNSPELRETNKIKPEYITKIASNPNPKNETPAAIGVNALARGLDTTNKVVQMAQQLGIDLQTGPRTPEEKRGFFDAVKQAFKNAQIQPGSIDEVAQRDYFTALFTGKGLTGAMEAFGNRYNQLADEQRKHVQAIQLEAAKEQIKYNIKTQERAVMTESAVKTISSVLTSPGANVPSQELAPIVQESSSILAAAKENPTAASGAARALLQRMSQSGIGDKQITDVARVFGDIIKVDNEKQKLYDNLSTIRGADLDGALTRWKFDIATDDDNKKVLALMDKWETRQATQAALAAAEKQKAEVAARALAEVTPVTRDGKTPQQIATAGKVAEQEALIPGKVKEQAELMPGKVKEAGQVAGAEANARLPAQKLLEDYKTGQEGQRVFNREAAQEVVKNIAASPELQGALNKYQKAIKAIDDGVVSIGPLSSTQPLQQWFGKNLPNPTEASQKTKDVEAAIDSIIQKMAKDLGANPSDRDLQFLMRSKPNVATDSPARVRDWLDSAAKKITVGAQTTEALGTAAGIKNMPKPVGGAVEPPATPAQPKVKKYNPQTGKVE